MPKKKPAPPAPFTPTPRCDVCGTADVPLTREPVEGIVCERCPDCKRHGLVP